MTGFQDGLDSSLPKIISEPSHSHAHIVQVSSSDWLRMRVGSKRPLKNPCGVRRCPGSGNSTVVRKNHSPALEWLGHTVPGLFIYREGCFLKPRPLQSHKLSVLQGQYELPLPRTGHSGGREARSPGRRIQPDLLTATTLSFLTWQVGRWQQYSAHRIAVSVLSDRA